MSQNTVKIGDCTVTMLSDGWTTMPDSIFPAFDATRVASAGQGQFKMPIAAFLLRLPGRTILIDTGSSGNFGPSSGQFPARLAATGCAVGQVDTIVMTHLHSDHFGGLVTPDGAAVFSRARLALSADEWRHAHDAGVYARATPERQGSFDAARRAVAPYEGRVDLLADGAAIAPGITVMALPGHTPGHIGLDIAVGPDRVWIIGDLVHCPDYQMSNPTWSVIYDHDPAQAAETRLRRLTQAAATGCLLLGAHLGGDHACRVKVAGTGFALIPAPARC